MQLGCIRTFEDAQVYHLHLDLCRLVWGALDLRHVFRSKKVFVFGVMEDITNDEH